MRLILIITFSCIPFIAYAAEIKCLKPTGDDWNCSAIFEFDTVQSAELSHARKIIYKNGDILLETVIEKEGKHQFFSNLHLGPSGIEFSRGDENLSIYSILMPLFAIEVLKTAYPAGPDSVPEGKAAKVARMIDKKKKETSLTVSTDRIDSHQVRYSLQNPNDSKDKITGLWCDLLADPLPDNFSVNEWSNSAKIQLKTLLDARSLRPDYKGYALAKGYTITVLDIMSETSRAFGINNVGQVVGNNSNGAVLWDKGKVQNLDTPRGKPSIATGISNAGQVVGVTYPTGGNWLSPTQAVIWSLGKMQELGNLGGTASTANAINQAGQAVGSAQAVGNKARHAVLWDKGKTEDLDPTGQDSTAYAINNAGQAVGAAGMSAVIWSNGSMHPLNLGGVSCAYGINDAGQVVGSDNSSGAEHAVLWNNGKMQDLDPFGDFSTAKSINNVGQVVGSAHTGTGKEWSNHAFLWDKGTATDLNSLPNHTGWVFNEATSINDEGKIVVIGYNNSHQAKAFLLTPESATPAPLLAF